LEGFLCEDAACEKKVSRKDVHIVIFRLLHFVHMVDSKLFTTLKKLDGTF